MSKPHAKGDHYGQKQSSEQVSAAAQATEPENAESHKAETKKKSRVAVFQSKSSLGGLAKDAAARIDQTPSSPEDEPKSKVKDNEIDFDGTYDNENLLDEYSFDNTPEAGNGDGIPETRLYTPIPRRSGVYPHSAPLPSSGQADRLESFNRMKYGMGTGTERTSQEDILEIDDANEQIDALLREEMPAIRMGQCLNSGPGAIIKTQSSIQSIRPERDSITPEMSSLTDQDDSQIRNGEPRGIERLVSGVGQSRFPSGTHGSNPQCFNMTMPGLASNSGRSFTETTSHGGLAPPPPDPNYQNTANLEQQLASHVQALHHHVNSVVRRLTKTFEGSNNWTMDQVLRNVESMSDTAKVMNSRSVNQSGNIMGLQQGMLEVCGQVGVLKHEIRRSEERLQATFRHEIEKLRRDINALVRLPSSSSSNSICGHYRPSVSASKGLRPERHLFQSASEIPGTKTKYLRTKKEQEGFNTKENAKPADEREVATAPRSVNKHVENKNGIVQQHRSGEQLPLPLTTPGRVDAEKTGTAYLQRKGSVRKDPAQESSGSPDPKPTKGSLDAASENILPEKEKTVDGSSRNNEEGNKTPRKKGSVFNFRRRRDNESQSSSASRFLRTPRRNKDGSKVASSDDLRKSATMTTSSSIATSPGTPPVPPVPADLAQYAANPRCDENMSPSAIHPALRNSLQQRIMQGREREQQHFSQRLRLQQQTSARSLQDPYSPCPIAPVRQPALRGSRSHQNFIGYRPSTAPSPSIPYVARAPPVADRCISASARYVPGPLQAGSSPSSGLQSLVSPQACQDPTYDWYQAYPGRSFDDSHM